MPVITMEAKANRIGVFHNPTKFFKVIALEGAKVRHLLMRYWSTQALSLCLTPQPNAGIGEMGDSKGKKKGFDCIIPA